MGNSENRLATVPLIVAMLLVAFFVLGKLQVPPAVDAAAVLTPTPSATHAAVANVPTMTPTSPYFQMLPDCGSPPYIEVRLILWNWHNSETVSLSWAGEVLAEIEPPQRIVYWRIANLLPGEYTIAAFDDVNRFERKFTVSDDCVIPTATLPPTTTPFATFTPGPSATPFPTVTPWATPTEFGTPAATATGPTATAVVPTVTPPPGTLGADLIVLGVEPLITPPLREYTPVPFRIEVANQGLLTAEAHFFVDVFLDPNPGSIAPTAIPLGSSSGFLAMGSLAPGSSRIVTLTAQYGFSSNGMMTGMRLVYLMADSALDVEESLAGELNNILGPIYIANVTPGPTRTVTPTPMPPTGRIAGIAHALGLAAAVPVGGTPIRAEVYLVSVAAQSGESQLYARTQAAADGSYQFNDVPDRVGFSYNVLACLDLDDGRTFMDLSSGVEPPDPSVDLLMAAAPAGCPYPQPGLLQYRYLPIMPFGVEP